MHENEYYDEAVNYLLSFKDITSEMINTQLTERQYSQPKSMKALLKSMLLHAQNRQGMPNSVGGKKGIEELSEALFTFNHEKVLKHYKCDWKSLFNTLYNAKFHRIQNTNQSNKKSHWVIYCQSIISICTFLSSFNDIDEFNQFTDSFLKNENAKRALPLLLSSEIFGFGFALACDFLKDNVSPDFVKPDTHINYIARNLGISSGKTDYEIFKDMMTYCNRINKPAYEVDKLFWLIGSGKFYLYDKEIKSSKKEFVSRVIGNQNL